MKDGITTEPFATDEMLLNMGPQHPSTHGVLRVVLRTDGEVVSNAEPVVGYLHRGIEKIAEALTWAQFMPYTDRVDYAAAMNCNMSYAMAVEKLAGIQVPERAEYIRVIMAELNRIASHLLFLGSMGNDCGAWTPFLYCFREREMILHLFEMTCGARLTYNYMRIGGVARDVSPRFIEKCLMFCDLFEPKVKEYVDLLVENRIFVERTRNVGILSPETAVSYGVTGPNLRASGVKWDLRKDEPYSIYPKLDFSVPIGHGLRGTVGDSWDRCDVRVREMLQCSNIVRQAVGKLPAGEFRTKLPRVLKVPAGEAYVAAENPRGELGFYVVSDGGTKPVRLKIRTGSFSSLAVMHEICRGAMLADIVAILGSIDFILPEVDR